MRRKILPYVRHTLVCLLFLAFPLIIYRESGTELIQIAFSNPYYWVFGLSLCFIYYINFFYLIPKFYLRKKYRNYFLVVLLLFVFFFFLKPFDLMFRYYYTVQKHKNVPPNDIFAIDLFTCIFFIILVSLGMAIQVVRQWRATESRAQQAETEKANAELSFLKAQINPHFLYNTLNNIYSLSVDNHADTSVSIMRLSNIMRYITDDATRNFVPLDSEISCIRDFIDLQRLRHSSNVKVNLTVEGATENKEIAPLILMTYIENVFKYGISSREEAPIVIKITAEADKIVFFCQNKIFAAPRHAESTGVGQANTRQRLNYLYPGKHILNITDENGLYTVELTLLT